MRRSKNLKCTWLFLFAAAILSFTYTGVKAAAAELPVYQIRPDNMNNSSAEPTSMWLSAGQDDATAVLTVKMPHSGVLQLIAAGSSKTRLRLYSDAACTKLQGEEILLTGDTDVKNVYIQIPKAGTYYLQYSNSLYASSVGRSAAVYAYAYDGDDKVLSDGKWAITYTQNAAKTVYHKIVLKKPAFVTLSGSVSQPSETAQAMSNLSVNLCGTGKKVISGGITMNAAGNYVTRFALKKGTYYIAVKQKDIVMIRYSAKTVKEKSGAKKSKAVKIKKNTQVEGILAVGEAKKKADWYKVTLSKKGKLQCDIANYGPAKIKVQVIPKNKKVKMKKGAVSTVQAQNGLKLKSKSKLPKGTYYIKVYKTGKTASSHYTLKCKYK